MHRLNMSDVHPRSSWTFVSVTCSASLMETIKYFICTLGNVPALSGHTHWKSIRVNGPCGVRNSMWTKRAFDATTPFLLFITIKPN